MAAMLGIPAMIAVALVVFSDGAQDQVELRESPSEKLDEVLKNRNPLAAAGGRAKSGVTGSKRVLGRRAGDSTAVNEKVIETKTAAVKSDRKWGRKATWNDKRIKMVTAPDAPNAQSTAAIPHPPGIRDYGKDEHNDEGMLSVVTRPPGMRVEANGILLGVSPVIRRMPADTTSVRLKLSKDGFMPITQTVKPNDDGEFHFSVKMKPKNL